jgi:F0F1-type ATP synthase epsilon subunit
MAAADVKVNVFGLGTLRAFLGVLHRIDNRLARIEHELGIIRTEEENMMGTIEEGFTEVETSETNVEASLATLTDEETRELADLQAALNNGDVLSPENQARFDALSARLDATKAALDAQVAAIETVDPTPVVTPVVDGSGDVTPAE